MRVTVVLCKVWHHSIEDTVINRSGGLVVKVHDFSTGKAVNCTGKNGKGSHEDLKKIIKSEND